MIDAISSGAGGLSPMSPTTGGAAESASSSKAAEAYGNNSAPSQSQDGAVPNDDAAKVEISSEARELVSPGDQ